MASQLKAKTDPQQYVKPLREQHLIKALDRVKKQRFESERLNKMN